MEQPEQPRRKRVSDLPALRALRYRDFRLLWIGAFVSFTGSVVQNVAQQGLVFQMTKSPNKLAMVSFAMMLPVSIFGPLLGVTADMYDKRKLLIVCMLASAVGPLFLGFAIHNSFVQYWMLIVVAAISGFVTCIEVPTRQSIVRSVVDQKDLAAAIPAQASTFNLARVIGPAIATFFLKVVGPALCFWANGLSFFALALSALWIKTDLKPVSKRVEPIRDLVVEGFKYTFRDRTLRTLFLMEASTAMLGTFYMSQMAAIVGLHLRMGQEGTGIAFACVGVGAITGLVMTASLSAKPLKPLLVRVSMTVMAVSIVLMGLVRVPFWEFLIMSVTGACTIVQFNTTNTLFQLLSPPNLRGRVISMHMWAISGIAPFGVLVFGSVSEWFGIATSLLTGGSLLGVVTVWAWTQRRHVQEPDGAA